MGKEGMKQFLLRKDKFDVTNQIVYYQIKMNMKNRCNLFVKSILLITFIIFNSELSSQNAYKLQKDIPYYSEGTSMNEKSILSDCTLDIYYPTNSTNFATIIWFHGGGLISGKKEIPQELLEKGFAVIGVGYRLSPKVTAATCIDDAAAAIAWTFKHIEEYGGNANAIFLAGHSAGAYLSLMTTLNKKYLELYNIDSDSIAGVIALSSQAITHFTIRNERGIDSRKPIIDEFAPLYHIRENLPPIILVTGDAELEMLGRYEENAYFYRMLMLQGSNEVRLYKLDGYNHGMMVQASYPLLLREAIRLAKRKGVKIK